jgi:hypothetical protein
MTRRAVVAGGRTSRPAGDRLYPVPMRSDRRPGPVLAATLLAAAACTLPTAAERGKTWSAPPRGFQPPPAVVAAATRGLKCDSRRVYVDATPELLQASGCGRVAYFERPSPDAGWEQVGSAQDLPPGYDLKEVEGRIQGARLRMPSRTGGADPTLTFEQASQLHSWTPRAVVTCLLGTDGALHACHVQADEAAVKEAVSAAIPAIRYRPATADGVPIPVTYMLTVNVTVTRPDCYGLGSMLQRSQCERAANSVGGPAQAARELRSLDLPVSY